MPDADSYVQTGPQVNVLVRRIVVDAVAALGLAAVVHQRCCCARRLKAHGRRMFRLSMRAAICTTGSDVIKPPVANGYIVPSSIRVGYDILNMSTHRSFVVMRIHFFSCRARRTLLLIGGVEFVGC